MGEGTECLRPNNTEISNVTVGESSKAKIEAVTDQVTRQTGKYSRTTEVAVWVSSWSIRMKFFASGWNAHSQMIRDERERIRDRDLDEESHRRESVRFEISESERSDNRRRVRVESALRGVVGH